MEFLGIFGSPMLQRECMAAFMDDFDTQSNRWFQLFGQLFDSNMLPHHLVNRMSSLRGGFESFRDL